MVDLDLEGDQLQLWVGLQTSGHRSSYCHHRAFSAAALGAHLLSGAPRGRLGRGPPVLPRARGTLRGGCGSAGSGAAPPPGSSRAPGRAFVALKTFQRACHGDAQRPGGTHAARASCGELFRVLAVSLSLSDAPPPGLALGELPPSGRGPSLRRGSALVLPGPAARPRRRPSPRPPAGSLVCRFSEWPGPVPRSDCQRAPGAARSREGGVREGRRGRAEGPAAAWSRLFANGPKRHVQVASHSGGGGGGAGAPDGTAGERGARTGSERAAPPLSFVSRRGADLRLPGRLLCGDPSPRRALLPRSPPPPPPSRPCPLSPPGAGDPAPARLALLLLWLPFSPALLPNHQWEGAGPPPGLPRLSVRGLLPAALFAPSRERHMERHEPGERTGPAQDRESWWPGGAPLPAAWAPTRPFRTGCEPGRERGAGAGSGWAPASWERPPPTCSRYLGRYTARTAQRPAQRWPRAAQTPTFVSLKKKANRGHESFDFPISPEMLCFQRAPRPPFSPMSINGFWENSGALLL